MLKLAIFDLDQTLINTLARFYKIFNIMLENFGCKIVTWDVFIKKYHKDTLDEFICVDKKTFWNEFLRHYNDIQCEKDRPINGAIETLRSLKGHRVKIVITTGRMVPSNEVWKELKRYDMDKYVDYVITRFDYYGDGKRRTEMIEFAMQKFGANPNETIFVGDYWPDMQSGKETGVLTIGVLTGHENEEKLKKNGANVVIENVGKLMDVIGDML